ncbi:MAG: hypothetical protein ACXVLQ_09665 [Bacteriovorax sp.]
MKKCLIFIFIFNFSAKAFADDDLCKFFKYCGQGSNSRNSAQSLPSSSSAANLNPSNVGRVTGFGIESIYQPHNSLVFNFVSGNGKIGALISPTLENSFFGNRSIEIDDLYLARREGKKQYKNKKLNLSLGASIIEREKIGLDFGLSLKRNPDIKKINPGAGVSARLYFITLGAYIYKDDVKIELGQFINPYSGLLYSTQYNGPTYEENFLVKTYTAGMKLGNLSLDAGEIRTHYKFYNEDTRIHLYSASYAYKKYLFNYAVREELSPNLFYDQGALKVQRKKRESYYGVQYLANRHLMVGLSSNYFLLHELAASLTLFF